MREPCRCIRLVPQNEQSGAVDLQYAVERREFAGLIAVGLTPLFLALFSPSRALNIVQHEYGRGLLADNDCFTQRSDAMQILRTA